VNSAFWDSSALIPLFITESKTMSARSLAAGNQQAVWWGTRVEIRSAIARQYRSGMLDSGNRAIAINRLSLLVKTWREIIPDHGVRELAADLLDRYSLRAADSMQLAAALIWCSQKPAGRTFICSDLKLAEAAETAGFTTIRP
jgi:predicted nucleic acid-binding protein